MKLSRVFVVVLVGAIAFAGSFPFRAAAAGLRVTEMAVTTKIVRGNPIDSVHRISSRSVPALFCFTRVVNGLGEDTTIKHVWYKDGVKVAEDALPVKGARWRTYSKKSIGRDAAGEWRVDALGPDGTVLESVKFRIN